MLLKKRFCFFLLVYALIPYNLYAWRGHEIYASFGMGIQSGDDFEVISTDPAKPFTRLNFDSGLVYSSYVGYSITDFIVFEAQMMFSGMNSNDNYFSLSRSEIFTSDDGGNFIQNIEPKRFGETFRSMIFFGNVYLNLDTGFDFIPFVGFGIGPSFLSFSGFGGRSLATQVFFGGDLLLVPGFSVSLILKLIKISDTTFYTVHRSKKLDSNGDAIIREGRTVYEDKNYEDTIKAYEAISAEISFKFAF